MKEIKVNKIKQLTVPDGANALQINHEWGDVVLAATGLTPGDTFDFTPDSIGDHSILWKNGTTIVKREYYGVYQPIITIGEFFGLYPDLDSMDDKFPQFERRARGIIESYTGQKFGPYINKTIRLAGEGGETLELALRIRNLAAVTDTYGSDFSDIIEIAPGTGYFLQRKHDFRHYGDIKRDIGLERSYNFFTDRLDFVITGDFGWPYVPSDVSEAAALLISDGLSGNNDLRLHGINEAQLGDFKYKLNADQWGTTGNTQADLLLSPYVIVSIGLV